MVPVSPLPEPAKFQKAVRAKGGKWILKSGFDPALPAPEGTKLPRYWKDCVQDLWSGHEGICSYSGIYIHPITGSTTVEHFAPKSRRLDLAYEWSNYRLACNRINSVKSEFEDVLDPFQIAADTFFIEFATGRVYANPALAQQGIAEVNSTIERLKLNEQHFRDSRTGDFVRYLDKDWSAKELRRVSPFVWYEANRQGLL